jgi:MoaA/NifB/PqqE/SkfB family radical SAM enzyme
VEVPQMALGHKIKQHTEEFCEHWRDEGFSAAFSYSWKILNQLCLKIRVSYINSDVCFKYPEQVDIEFTTKCNLQCPFCPHSQIHNDDIRHLEPATLELILNRFPFKPSSVTLGGVGEPLTNPNFVVLVDILAAYGIKCKLFTNGTLFNPRIIEMLLARDNLSF